jgi:hypothetical protein
MTVCQMATRQMTICQNKELKTHIETKLLCLYKVAMGTSKGYGPKGDIMTLSIKGLFLTLSIKHFCIMLSVIMLGVTFYLLQC